MPWLWLQQIFSLHHILPWALWDSHCPSTPRSEDLLTGPRKPRMSRQGKTWHPVPLKDRACYGFQALPFSESVLVAPDNQQDLPDLQDGIESQFSPQDKAV